jgi:hypothetical protein
MGVTTQGDGVIDSNGQVRRVYIVINYEQREDDFDIEISTSEDAWGVQMGDGSIIICNEPKVIEKTKSSCVVQFTLGSFYPSNSPCQLIYRTNKAYIGYIRED